MKQAEVKIGEMYYARVGSNLVAVRVAEVTTHRARSAFWVVNEKTGRRMVRSAAGLRTKQTVHAMQDKLVAEAKARLAKREEEAAEERDRETHDALQSAQAAEEE